MGAELEATVSNIGLRPIATSPGKWRIISMDNDLLAEVLNRHKDKIGLYLNLGRAEWENLIKTIRSQEKRQSPGFADEQIWTFLIGCGYALCGEAGIRKLTKILTGSDQTKPLENRIWFEFLPLPPRQGEGKTSIDLALGTISQRNQTKGGIQLDVFGHPWVCFCEMKYKSDISIGTTHDVQRNQLLRVIENALCFQNAGNCADRVFVTLVTPEVFRYPKVKSRLYQYIYEEYKNDHNRIIHDLEKCSLELRKQKNWWYPADIIRRAESLCLNWITYEELFNGLPYLKDASNSRTLSRLIDFWERYGRLA